MAGKKHKFLYSIFLSFLPVLMCSHASPPWQAISTGASLQVDHEEIFLVSPDTTFSCGFYSSGKDTNAYYFSIWFTHATDRTVVWTADPGSPVNGHGSKISLNHEGNLILTDVNGSTVWESKTSWGKDTTVALLNSGNLVLRDFTDKVVWQSFDSPTNTLLPSQRLTRETRLVSRSGYHILYFDNDNVLRLLYNAPEITSIYWPSPDYSAPENGRTRFNSSKIAVLDNEGNFLSSDGFRMAASDSGFGVKRRITIDHDGNFRMYSLNASDGNWTVTGVAVMEMCYVHGLCGTNGLCDYSQPQDLRCTCPLGYKMTDPKNWNKGCRPAFSMKCRQPQEDFTFKKIPHGDFYGFDLTSNKSISFNECRQICLDICPCLSFTYKAGQGLCYIKNRLYNGQVFPNFPGDTYMKLPKKIASTSSVSKNSGLTCSPKNTKIMLVSKEEYMKNSDNINWIYFYVFAGILGAVELLFIMTGWYFLFKMHDIPKSMEEGYKMVTSQFRRFTYRELVEATGKFKEELGKGGSGTVYRGILGDKKVVAIKKLTRVRQGEEEFWAEVTLIGRINHINLVRMWGFCSEGKHRLLVYEYVENESLDKCLFGDRGTERLLSWTQRFKVALGTAKGLAYLHHECLEWVVHCDVKPENILLTRDFEAKIADFGLSKLSKRESTSFDFTRMRGTMGYMAPEWALNLPINAKVDVYSYGVVLLEIVTGSRVSSGITIEGEEEEEERDFIQFVQEIKQIIARGGDVDIVDARLKGHFNHEQATVMVKIAVSCLEERSSKRPTMDQIVKDLMVYDDEDNHPAYFYDL